MRAFVTPVYADMCGRGAIDFLAMSPQNTIVQPITGWK
jgi:hypothetical protein